MRITFLLPPLSVCGGIKVIGIHAAQLKRLGHEMSVVAQRNPAHLIDRLLSRADPEPFFDAINVIFADRAEIVSGNAVPEADVVIATWWETGEWVQVLTKSRGQKLHFVQGHEVFPYLPIDRVTAVYRLPIRKVAVSNWLAETLRREYPGSVVSVVPNAVDSTFFDAAPRSKQAAPTFGFIYSSTPCKNVDTCIAALEEVRRTQQNLRAISFGVERASLPSWIRYHQNPAQNSIPSLYSSCDAWLMPSLSEGFGLPILEAMACRTPVIGTRAGAGATYISDLTGAIAEPTVESLSDKIACFCAMGAKTWRRKSDAARRRILGETWEKSARLLETQILIAASGNSNSSCG